MIIKKFKNGNFNVKLENNYDDISESLLVQLCNSMELDFGIAIDKYGFELLDYCIGNFACATDLYNYNTDKIYTITGKDTIDFMNGKTIKLYAQNNCYN